MRSTKARTIGAIEFKPFPASAENVGLWPTPDEFNWPNQQSKQVKNNKLRLLGLLAVSALATSKAFAVGEVSEAVTAISAIPTTIGVIAGAVAAVTGGLIIFKMVKKYLGKAS